jgi:hypothetical protein
MANYFELYLDTTPPEISIQCLGTAIWDEQFRVEINTSPDFDPNFQRFYIIDKDGERHDVVFSAGVNGFVGYVSFAGYPVGDVTLYAQVRDTTGHYSEVVNKDISIVWNTLGDIIIGVTTRQVMVNVRDKW